MLTKKRRFPPGVQPRSIIALERFLPYRAHLLSSRISRPADFALPDGRIIRARDWRVILQLACRGPLTNRELSRMVALDAANITRVVQNLGELGLVTTRPSSTDRRKQIISLTAEGAAAHDAIAPNRLAASDAMLSCFSPKEREQFFNMLDRLDEQLQKEESDDEWED